MKLEHVVLRAIHIYSRALTLRPQYLHERPTIKRIGQLLGAQSTRILSVYGLLVAMTASSASAQSPPSSPTHAAFRFEQRRKANPRDLEFDRVRTITRTKGSARVIVQFNVPNIDALSTASQAAKRPADIIAADGRLSAAIAAVRQVEIGKLAGTVHTINRTYASIPFVALTLSDGALDVLERMPIVLGINEDRIAFATLDNTVNIVGAPPVWTSGFDGTGWYVAVLDTGIRASHNFFAGKNIIQACFALGDDGAPGAGDCPNGMSTDTTSPNAAQHHATSPNSDHGTHVAGIATGNDPTRVPPLYGVAREADIIAIQVFTQSSTACGGNPCLISYASDQIAGMDHVFSLRSAHNIASVNLSLGASCLNGQSVCDVGTGGCFDNQAACDAANAGFKFAVDNLSGAGIATVIASGNDKCCGLVASPACVTPAVAVGATSDSDVEPEYSNFHPTLLDIFAPGGDSTQSGGGILSSVGISDTSYSSYEGTSMATPHVAGAWAVLKQAFPGADVTTILNALQTTGDPVTGRCVTSPTQSRIRIDLAVDYLESLDSECVDPPGSAVRRPIWAELATPGGSGYPDYQNVSSNLQILESLRLLASIFTRAAQKLEDLTSEEDDETEGRCLCSLTDVNQDVKRKDCCSGSAPCVCTSATTPYPLWLPTDLFKNANNTGRFALNYFDFLDGIVDILNDIQSALEIAGEGVEDFETLVATYLEYVDIFTEGYHLGGYSIERPELHLCVGYGGHGAFAEMLNLFDEVSIGGRYTSHNLSKENRAQFRSGGFAVDAFGRTLSLLPGIEANLQINGFKMWNSAKPFGIDLGVVGDPSCTDGAGFQISDIEKYDIFHLVDANTDLAQFDEPNGTPDGCLQPGEFLIDDFYEATFEIGSGTYTWPRPEFATLEWEKRNTAVFGAGLNLPLKMKRIEKCIPPGAPPCPGPGIFLFPGATLYPKLTLDAGVEWSHKAFGLRARLQDMVNLNLPVNLQLGPEDFERPMHFLQAPDVSGDDGTSAYVQPRVAADLLFGKALGRYLTLGITVNVGISVRVEPAAYGGVHDLNIALTETLLNSNPPRDLPCDPIIESNQTIECANTYYVNDGTQAGGEPGDPLSTGVYTCDTTEVVVYHCKEPEQTQTCTPQTAAKDCPATGECIPEYGCASHGYCTRMLDAGKDGLEGTEDDVLEVTHDTTHAACSGNSVCTEPAINEGASCDEDADCPAGWRCSDDQGQMCISDRDCQPPGVCNVGPSLDNAPCVQISPVGYFTPYLCLVRNNPTITGWQGPGCSPLTVGYASACGCASDADCVANVETCANGICAVGGTPVSCSCDQSSCPAGRLCEEGACVLSCATELDCAVYQTCTGGLCVNPYGIPFAEQIVWQVIHTSKPQHAVSTYALSDVLASAILDAGLYVGVDLKIFKKLYSFALLKISDAWVLAAFNKSWYQAGLEARYQNDCDLVSGDTVTNWQPGAERVNRYNPSNSSSGSLGNAGTEIELFDWCADTLPSNVSDPASPETADIINSSTDLLAWGEQIGFDIWALGGLCVTQADSNSDGIIDSLDGPPTSTPFTQWLEDIDIDSSGLSCSYVYNGQTYVFPCSELRNQTLLIWGCLNVNANQWAGSLATGFPSMVTTFDGHSVFNLDQMLIDPAAEFSLDNLKPQIRHYPGGLGFVGVFWYVAVSQCFEQRHIALQLQPGDLTLVGVDIGPCCGNGALDQNGCAMGPGGTPCEQCDDGNNAPGDGCSPLCRVECNHITVECGDGTIQIGLGEECDGADDAACPSRCRSDCTCTPIPTDCGDGVVQAGSDEECDGSDDAACPGQCQSDCSCLPIPVGCGDGIVQAGSGEQCDGNDDAACPGQCQANCICPQPVECEPLANGSGCQPTICPSAGSSVCAGGINDGISCAFAMDCPGGTCQIAPDNQCVPVVARVVPSVPTTVVACDCLLPSSCKLNLAGAGPTCGGLCPTGQECIETFVPGPLPGSVDSSCCCVTQTPICTPPPTGMIAWWALDESTGPVAFDSAGNNDATHVGGPIPNPFGKVDGSLKCTTGYAEAPGAPFNVGQSDFTIDAWVKLPFTSQPGEFWVVDRGHNFHLAVSADASSRIHFEYPCGIAFWPNSAPLGTWFHIAVTVSRNQPFGLTMYYNGIQVGNTNSCSYNVNFAAPLTLGGGSVDGELDEIEIFNRALDPSEILAVYQAGSAGKCKCAPLPDGSGCTNAQCGCFGECTNGSYCDDPDCCIDGGEPPSCAQCYARNHQASIKLCGECFGECLNGGYCDSGSAGCSLGPAPQCYATNSPYSIYLCGDCFGQCVDGSYCDKPNPNCCIEPGDCKCYVATDPISIAMCGQQDDCHPTCVNYDPATDTTIVKDCNCGSANECHATVPTPGGGPPVCVNACPLGATCTPTETANPDGTIDVCCQCAIVGDSVPTASGWGLAIMALLLITGATLCVRRHEAAWGR